MKRKFALAAFTACFAFAISASAQKVTDFSGVWELDIAKSKLEERSRIESQTMTVKQDANQILIETATKRIQSPDGAARRGDGRGGAFGSDVPATYTLDGKEAIVEQESRMGTIPVRFSAKWNGAKLHLLQSRTFTTPNGEVTAETKGAWEISSDGKVLTVIREMTTPQGAQTLTLVYNRRQ